MILKLTKPQTRLTVGDLYDRFGAIPLDRIRFDPWPGTATADDVQEIHAHEKRLFEMVDGILVEKTMGLIESFLAMEIGRLLGNWVKPRKLGLVAGEAGMMRLTSGRVRIPDVSFLTWDRLPGRKAPREPIPELVPDLAVEVLSSSNTKQEMDDKLREYFRCGVRLVWYVDPSSRTVAVYTSTEQPLTLSAEQVLDGGQVLPGFTLSLKELFGELDEEGPSQKS
jgi:Uma2 family endonuclease